MPEAETADRVESERSARLREDAWRSRIVRYGEEAPDQLLAHPDNWRIHSRRQAKALTQLLDRVGWVQNVVVNDRTGHVLDGHLRVGEAISRGEPSVPVTYVDLTEEEERLVLASLDPVASLASVDSSTLMSLLSSVDVDGELEELLRRTAGMEDAVQSSPSQEQIDQRKQEMDESLRTLARNASDEVVDVTCPACGHDFGITVPGR